MTPDLDMLHLKLNTLEALSHPKVLVAGDSYIAGTFCRTVNTGQFFEQMRECLHRMEPPPLLVERSDGMMSLTEEGAQRMNKALIDSTEHLYDVVIHEVLVADKLIKEAEDWLFRMREHKDCCGTPIVRKLLEVLKG